MEAFATEAAKPKRGRQGQWKTIIADIKKDKAPRKVSGLTRGSVSAGSRAARDAGLRYVTQYPDKDHETGFIIIAPQDTKVSAPKKKDAPR